MQRLRVTYSVDGPLRFASHLERARVWERAVRRAGLPLAYSGGFNPRPRMQVAAALPVGFAAQGEMLDLWFEQPVDPAVAQAALGRALPDGLHVVQVEETAPAEPPLQTQVTAAVYIVAVETAAGFETVRRRVADLLAAQVLPRQRRGRSYDLRPLIQRLSAQAGRSGEVVLEMELAAREGATGRPEEVIDALGLAEDFFRVRRERLLTEPAARR